MDVYIPARFNMHNNAMGARQGQGNVQGQGNARVSATKHMDGDGKQSGLLREFYIRFSGHMIAVGQVLLRSI